MKRPPSEPPVTMNSWFGEIAIYRVQVRNYLNSYLCNTARVADTRVVADSLIVVPKSDDFVFSSRDEVFTFLHDSEGVEFSRLGAIEHTDCLAIEAVPVSDLAIRSCGKELRLIWVEHDLLEHS